MKSLLKPNLLILFLGLIFSIPTWATDGEPSNAELRAQIQKIILHQQALEKEIKSLRSQLAQQKREQKEVKTVVVRTAPVNQNVVARSSHPPTPSVAPSRTLNSSLVTVNRRRGNKYIPAALRASTVQMSQDSFHGVPSSSAEPGDDDYSLRPVPVSVMTSAFFSETTKYDASDLLRLYPNINEDLVLLKERQELVNKLYEQGFVLSRPLIELSGSVEGLVYSYHGFGVHDINRGITLNTAELDVNAIASEWANAYMQFYYDKSPVAPGSRVPNGRVFLRRGFLNIGNLNVTPFYMTLGEMFLPFGRYNNIFIDNPVTQLVGRIRTSAALLGFYKNGLNIVGFGYSGAQTSLGQPIVKQWGGGIIYRGTPTDKIAFQLGTSAVTNIADSESMQNNLIPIITGPNNTVINFGGFAKNPNGNRLRRNYPGVDVNGQIKIGGWALSAEYVGATQTFNPNDLSFNRNVCNNLTCIKGARPQAFYSELDYVFELYGKPSSLGLGYGHTWQALALNLPQNSYMGVFNISIWKNTVESIEYRHDTNYHKFTTAGGANVPFGNSSSGGSRNAVYLQVGVFF